MKRIFCATLTMLLLSVVVGKAQNIFKTTEKSANNTQQDIPSLIKILTDRGYVIDEETKDKKALERYLALDNKLTSKQDSLDDKFNSLKGYFKYVNESRNADETRNKIMEFARRSKEIRYNYRMKPQYPEIFATVPVSYTAFLDKYERAINGFNKTTDVKDIQTITDELITIKAEVQQDSTLTAKRETANKNEMASLPTKSAVKAKFRTYSHRTGNVFEMFPVGFTPKANKPVIDRVFGRKARYREVDGNGMNTFIMDFYDSGNIMNVTVYGGKGGGSIYYAEYRDHAKKPYEIRTHSADGKFYVVHKRIYDMYDNKTNITTKYQYVPLDYWYE